MARIFISYSRTDEAFARQLAASLADMGADIWIDVEDIPVGLKWSRAIQEGLDRSDVLIVIISPDSMSSTNVEDEWQYFLEQRKPVIPVLWQPAKVHFQLSRVQYVDFNKHRYELALRQLHSVLTQIGLALKPLPGIAAPLPAQQSLPVRQDSMPESGRRARPAGWMVWGAVVVIGVIVVVLLSLNPLNPLVVSGEPTTTAENTPAAAPTDTLTPTSAPTATPSMTSTPTPIPTDTPTLSATDIEGTVLAEIAAIPTQEAETQAAAQTATATLWTATPTFDARATARARVTETYQALIAEATAVSYAAQTQAMLDQTATATLWTATPSPTMTPPGGGALIAFSHGADAMNEDIYVLDSTTLERRQITTDPAYDLHPDWSPDGTRIVFTSTRSGNRDLYVVDADGNNLTRLTFTGEAEEDPVWSPDGRYIAYSLRASDGERDLWVMNADGTHARQLTNRLADDRAAAWSPDGTRIAFHSDRKDEGYYQIYLLDATCSTPEVCEASITPIENAYGTFPAWSPDGDQLVFQTNMDGNWNIYTIRLNGAGLRRLTDDPREDRRPTWSPDGTQIVFQSSRDGDFDLYTVHVTGGEPRRLTDNDWMDNDPVWQPGGG